MMNKMYCPICGEAVAILIQPYKNRGRFAYRTGSCCGKCLSKLEKEIKGEITKENFTNWRIKNGKK